MKQLEERFMTFKAYIESSPWEHAAISSINSINLSLLHHFQLVLTVSAVSERDLLQVPSLGEKFWKWNFFKKSFCLVLQHTCHSQVVYETTRSPYSASAI